ncbi:MAG TPA: elongation factor Ts [Gammaproteobacteria bacterium]|jgi:elongation factor Ts|nr:elongation factor Ts [Gammaproteobacteria bacterium]HIM70417.1 elongation factor Ts [Gammaproteobacteria bacterium]HIN60620.1 elongation factor Ts [Gammaproteobacteria bacterium]
MSISASQVKQLREQTGAGMMDCKRALEETTGNIEAAIDFLRKKGAASAERKASRIASEGIIGQWISDDGSQAVMVEVNCETDFVAKDESFGIFVAQIIQVIAVNRPTDLEALGELALGASGSVNEARLVLIGRVGENIGIRRFECIEAASGSVLSGYLHGQRIGVVMGLKGGQSSLGRDLAMHVAASRPLAILPSGIAPELLEREKNIVIAQAAESGKADAIVEKIVAGRMTKFVRENTLVGQAFVKNVETTVEELLTLEGAEVSAMVCYEVGEGLEKRSDDFVAEVMAQAQAG